MTSNQKIWEELTVYRLLPKDQVKPVYKDFTKIIAQNLSHFGFKLQGRKLIKLSNDLIHTVTQERLKELLHYNPETGAFIWIAKPAPRANRIKVGSVAGSNKGNGYVQIQIDGKNYLAQRLAYLFVYGRMPVGDIDHSDGNPSK